MRKPICEDCGRTLFVEQLPDSEHYFCDVCNYKLSRTITAEFTESNKLYKKLIVWYRESVASEVHGDTETAVFWGTATLLELERRFKKSRNEQPNRKPLQLFYDEFVYMMFDFEGVERL